MAIAWVNGTNTLDATAVATLTITYTPTAGNMVIVQAGFNNTITAPSCVDNNGNALTLIQIVSGLAYMFYGPAITGATSYKVSWTTSRAVTLLIGEYSGTNCTVGATNTATLTGSTSASIALTPLYIGSWVVAGFQTASLSTTFSAGGLGNLREQTGSNASVDADCFGDNFGVGLASVTITFTISTSSTWHGLAIEIPAQATASSWDQLRNDSDASLMEHRRVEIVGY